MPPVVLRRQRIVEILDALEADTHRSLVAEHKARRRSTGRGRQGTHLPPTVVDERRHRQKLAATGSIHEAE
jgi:hypothetical protein